MKGSWPCGPEPRASFSRTGLPLGSRRRSGKRDARAPVPKSGNYVRDFTRDFPRISHSLQPDPFLWNIQKVRGINLIILFYLRISLFFYIQPLYILQNSGIFLPAWFPLSVPVFSFSNWCIPKPSAARHRRFNIFYQGLPYLPQKCLWNLSPFSSFPYCCSC